MNQQPLKELTLKVGDKVKINKNHPYKGVNIKT